MIAIQSKYERTIISNKHRAYRKQNHTNKNEQLVIVITSVMIPAKKKKNIYKIYKFIVNCCHLLDSTTDLSLFFRLGSTMGAMGWLQLLVGVVATSCVARYGQVQNPLVPLGWIHPLPPRIPVNTRTILTCLGFLECFGIFRMEIPNKNLYLWQGMSEYLASVCGFWSLSLGIPKIHNSWILGLASDLPTIQIWFHLQQPATACNIEGTLRARFGRTHQPVSEPPPTIDAHHSRTDATESQWS